MFHLTFTLSRRAGGTHAAHPIPLQGSCVVSSPGSWSVRDGIRAFIPFDFNPPKYQSRVSRTTKENERAHCLRHVPLPALSDSPSRAGSRGGLHTLSLSLSPGFSLVRIALKINESHPRCDCRLDVTAVYPLQTLDGDEGGTLDFREIQVNGGGKSGNLIRMRVWANSAAKIVALALFTALKWRLAVCSNVG
jgi:hypothetical protein